MSSVLNQTGERPQLVPELATELAMDAVVPDSLVQSGEPVAAISPGIPSGVAEHLAGGTGALGLGMFIERGAGFLANILAFRYGGAATFGAYSLSIATANNISTYAAGQIGSTAARFSGKYPRGTPGYSTLSRVLTVVSLVSAGLAAAALWFGAAPLAHLLRKDSLTGLLQWAAISACGIILLECARGFFVGQRRLAALVVLSLVVGAGMLILLPLAARAHSPVRMIVSQGAITLSAVVVCLLLARPLQLHAPGTSTPSLPVAPMLREVWSFGFVQLAGLIGSNLAGWWLTTLVARADTTLVQMSFFAVAGNLRNMAGIVPGLLTEGSYAVMASPEGESSGTPHRVMALCTFASLAVSLLLACIGITLAPWILALLYGHAAAGAAAATAMGLAIAVVHMGNAPAAARLTIVSIRATGVINTIWAVFVAAAASLILFRHGDALRGMAIYFTGHVLSAGLVLLTLHRKDFVPSGMGLMYCGGAAVAATMAALATLRDSRHDLVFSLTIAMALLSVTAAGLLFVLGRQRGLMPSAATLRRLRQSVAARFGGGRLAAV